MSRLLHAAEKGLRALRVSRIVLMHPDSMAVADAAIAAMEPALEQQEKKNPTRQMPEWIDYDPATDVLTIHGRRYSAVMFGEQGFLSPVGTLLQVAEGQPDCVTLQMVPPTQQPKPVAWVKIQQGEITHSEMSDGSGCDFDLVGAGFVPLYTHPQRREWRGLTPDETMHLMTKTAGQHWADEAHIQRFRGALEGKLRERNT